MSSTVFTCGRHSHPQTDAQAPRTTDCYMCRLELEMARFMPRQPRYRYFWHRAWMYCWTTERMNDGKFAAFIYRPIGKGARLGTPSEWKIVKEIHFTKRSTAKARALKWYETAKKNAA